MGACGEEIGGVIRHIPPGNHNTRMCNDHSTDGNHIFFDSRRHNNRLFYSDDYNIPDDLVVVVNALQMAPHGKDSP
jgi:hypothetical protein